MELRFLIIAALVVAFPSLYILTANVAPARLPMVKNKRICLLIAHPDDEAMFFAPTVLALTRPETGNHVKILCLSTGNADGLGETRKKELVKSGMTLGLRDEDDVFVIDSPTEFPDSMTTTWDRTKIANLLGSAFAPELDRQRSENSDQPTASIDVLITFDNRGISSHPNHISLYYGARTFIAALTLGKPEWNSPVDMYTLTTVGFARKYSSFFDTIWTLLGARGASAEPEHPRSLVFMNSLVGSNALGTAWTAMTEAHKSQMVWFRYGWITLSRYMVINDLRLEKVKVN